MFVYKYAGRGLLYKWIKDCARSFGIQRNGRLSPSSILGLGYSTKYYSIAKRNATLYN